MITAGKVLNSFGLNGQVKIDVYLEDLKLLKTVEVFLLGNSLLKRKINFLKNTKKSTWIAAISEVKTKEQADQLKGQLIFLEKKYLPSLMTNEFYYEDLKGLQIKIDGGLKKVSCTMFLILVVARSWKFHLTIVMLQDTSHSIKIM